MRKRNIFIISFLKREVLKNFLPGVRKWKDIPKTTLALVITSCLLLTPPPSFAQAVTDPFTTSMNVLYQVQETGQTNVRYEIRLRNNLSTVYAREYALQINSPDVTNVAVRDADDKTLARDIVQSELQTSITVRFPEDDRVVGRDQERLFTIEYTSEDTSAIYGQILEVTIPKLADPEKYTQYNVIVTVPEEFGQPSIVEPNQYTLDRAGGSQILRFTDAGKATGISVLFGEQQTYGFSTAYHVANSSQNVGVVQVALIPDTAYQQVWYKSIVPEPETIHRDIDGNWIAEFRVAGEAQQDIQVNGEVTVYSHPTVPVPVENPLRKQESWLRTEVSPYLQGRSFWQVENPLIQQIARENQTPREIYKYVVDTLQYNYRRLEQPDATQRYGAVASLQDPTNAMCQEFTDVFIAVARAAGIPARRATGYAVTQNSRLRPLSLVADVLHAWPEYYDVQRNIWVPIDPTWADTTGGVDYFSKLDLRHITFAIQGRDDSLPLPAGMYKLPEQESKDIAIELLDRPSDENSDLSIEHRKSYVPQFGLPTEETFLIQNTSGRARYNLDIAIGVIGDLDILNDPIVSMPVLLPYEEKVISVQLSGQNWWQASPGTVRLLIEEESYEYQVSARQALNTPYARWIFLGGGVALFSAGAGSLLVFGGRWYRAVRR